MSQLPRTAKAAEVEKVLRRLGWVRQKGGDGSHRQYKKAGRIHRVTVPYHGNEDLAVGTFNNILRQMGIDRERFFAELGR